MLQGYDSEFEFTVFPITGIYWFDDYIIVFNVYLKKKSEIIMFFDVFFAWNARKIYWIYEIFIL